MYITIVFAEDSRKYFKHLGSILNKPPLRHLTNRCLCRPTRMVVRTRAYNRFPLHSIRRARRRLAFVVADFIDHNWLRLIAIRKPQKKIVLITRQNARTEYSQSNSYFVDATPNNTHYFKVYQTLSKLINYEPKKSIAKPIAVCFVTWNHAVRVETNPVKLYFIYLCGRVYSFAFD